MARLFKYLGYAMFLPFWWLQLMIPRKKDIWIFGAWYGRRYSDNSKSLYLYVNKNHPEIKAIWLTRDVNIRDEIQRTNGICFLANSVAGIYYSLLAKNIIVSSGKRDVNYLFVNGSNLFQLWHGNPMKQIGLDDKLSSVNSFFQKKIVPVLFPFICEFNYDFVVSNASVFTDKMASAFNVPVSRIMETGCPRNDIFYSKEIDSFNDGLRAKYKDCKIIYYLPTFRSHHGVISLFTLEDYSKDILEDFLVKENMVFVSKGHYVDNQVNPDYGNSDGRLINLSDDKVIDINLMLKDADALITDYSGAYFDFLLTEKPIIFAAFDLEDYLSSSREMYFDYREAVAGPIATTWDELYQALRDVWDDPEYVKLIKEKKEVFNKFHDDQNSKRVYETIAAL
jgi:teichoic acid glycerol-phosphate transferase